MEKITGIYKITSPSGRIYIGQSVDVYRRWQSYRGLFSKVTFQPRLYNSFRKYGVDKHTFEVVEECSVEMLNERERYWQEYYNVLCDYNGLNCRFTKTKDKSGRVSNYTLKKMSECQKGEKHRNWKIKPELHPMFGRKHSEETKRKISLAGTGRKRSLESRLKISGKNNPNYGVRMSDEQKEKLRKKAYIRNQNKPHPRNKMVLDLSTGIYYENAKSCAFSLNIKYSTMKGRLNRNVSEKRFKYI